MTDLAAAKTEFETIDAQIDELYGQRANLHSRHADFERQIVALRKARIGDTIAGRPFEGSDDLRIAEYEAETIGEALSELDRRIDALRPEHEAAQKKARLADVEERLKAKMGNYIKTAQRFDAVVAEFSDIVAQLEEGHQSIARIRDELGANNDFDPSNLRTRIGSRIGDALRPFAPTGHYGALQWPNAMPATTAFHIAESSEIGRRIQGVIASEIAKLRDKAA